MKNLKLSYRRSGSQRTTTVILSLVLLAVFPAIPPMEHVPEEGYLARQTVALRAPFRHHLNAISDMSFYRINATLDLQNATVEGELTVRYTNTAERSLSELVFRLLPNAKTIYGGGSLTVGSVTRGSRALDFVLSSDQTVMRVPLSRRLEPGQTVALAVTFLTELPIGSHRGYGILNQTSRVTSLAGWYPILAVYKEGWQTPDTPQVGDALAAETSLYEVALTVPTEVNVVSTGTVTRLEKTGPEAVWHLVSGPAREFAAAISEDFEQHQAQVDGVTVRFHALPAAQARTSPKVALATIATAFRVYVDQFGPYPFTEFDVVEAPIPIGGYEFPGMVYADDRLRSQGAPADYRYIIAHEVAHQWWYGLVGNDSIREPWLDESLASYSASIYLEQAEGEDKGEAMVAYWRQTYGRRTAQQPPVNSPASDFSNWLTYRSPVYYQGALFLDALRGELGDEVFFSLMKRYVATYRYQFATTEDFLRLAETVSCRDLDVLFEQWFQVSASIAPAPCTQGLLEGSNLIRAR